MGLQIPLISPLEEQSASLVLVLVLVFNWFNSGASKAPVCFSTG